LSCWCPVNARRDFATVEVTYAPAATVVEIESFAAFLATQADQEMSHETATELIWRAVHDAIKPKSLTVATTWAPVEGVGCVVTTRGPLT
jgi:NADPH-dependent 7-cyano-7-deazaguanine reductase QueF